MYLVYRVHKGLSIVPTKIHNFCSFVAVGEVLLDQGDTFIKSEGEVD
jgi:hypothetical protein